MKENLSLWHAQFRIYRKMHYIIGLVINRQAASSNPGLRLISKYWRKQQQLHASVNICWLILLLNIPFKEKISIHMTLLFLLSTRQSKDSVELNPRNEVEDNPCKKLRLSLRVIFKILFVVDILVECSMLWKSVVS